MTILTAWEHLEVPGCEAFSQRAAEDLVQLVCKRKIIYRNRTCWNKYSSVHVEPISEQIMNKVAGRTFTEPSFCKNQCFGSGYTVEGTWVAESWSRGFKKRSKMLNQHKIILLFTVPVYIQCFGTVFNWIRIRIQPKISIRIQKTPEPDPDLGYFLTLTEKYC